VVILRLLLVPVLGHQPPLMLLILPCVLTAWYAGVRPALFALLLCALAGDYFFLPPFGSLAISHSNDVERILFFIAVVSFIIWLSHEQRISSRHILEDRELLAGLLDERTHLMDQIAEGSHRQRIFLQDVLFSVTEGKLRLCETEADLPMPLPPDGDPITLTPATLRDVRHKTLAVAVVHGLPDERCQDLVSATGECSMNAIQHGSTSGTAMICAEPGRVQVWIRDTGSGIAVTDLPRATLLKGHSGGTSFGHGFFIMLRTVDAIWLLTGPQGTTVVLEQSAIAPEPDWFTRDLEGF